MEKATYKLIKEILHIFNNKAFNGGIFYLKKAFDTVDHILLDKLEFYGIMGSC